ncbi:predicted protein, partial [Nematostella vectensis]
GVNVPRCESDGSFSSVQCNELTGYCWCVDRQGNPVFGTEVRGQPDCSARVGLTPCQKQRFNAYGVSESTPADRYVPRCDASGGYEPVQCLSTTGHCWCVDKDGIEIRGTRRRGVRPVCKQGYNTPCERERYRALGWTGLRVTGLWVPDCRPDGSYESVQCHALSGYCWCVDRSGHELFGTRVRGKRTC